MIAFSIARCDRVREPGNTADPASYPFASGADLRDTLVTGFPKEMETMMFRRFLLAWLATLLVIAPCLGVFDTPGVNSNVDAAALPDGAVLVGMAEVDITPDFPVRLAGYAGRMGEATEVIARLYGKALAIGGDDGDGPAVLIMLDNCGTTAGLTRDVSARLEQKAGIRAERCTVVSTHTHSAPLRVAGPTGVCERDRWEYRTLRHKRLSERSLPWVKWEVGLVQGEAGTEEEGQRPTVIGIGKCCRP
jgi:hypothetical protein